MPKDISQLITKSVRRRALQLVPDPDPVFPAIENHRRLKQLVLKDYRPDAAGGNELQEKIDIADRAAREAAWHLARAKPATVAGAAAMLRYVTAEPLVGLLDSGQDDRYASASSAVTAALAELARQLAA
jgi:hypothetical protein